MDFTLGTVVAILPLVATISRFMELRELDRQRGSLLLLVGNVTPCARLAVWRRVVGWMRRRRRRVGSLERLLDGR